MVSWGCGFWLHILQILAGSWKTVKYNAFVWLRVLASHTADPLWELEHCKILWFREVADRCAGFFLELLKHISFQSDFVCKRRQRPQRAQTNIGRKCGILPRASS